MQGQPETRTNDLLGRINSLSPRDRDNELLLKMLERQSREVLSTGDAAGGYTLLGALAAVRQDKAGVRFFHDKAVAASPRDPSAYRNYAISLIKLGSFDDAISAAERAWALDSSQLANLSLLVQIISSTGRIREAVGRVYAAKLPLQNDAKILELEELAALLEDRGISDITAGAIARAALEVVPPMSVTGLVHRVAADDETKWVDFALAVDESAERVTELNVALAERLSELTLDSEVGRASSAFVVRFTSSTGMDAVTSP
jgi:tetratricopeptide (TPR) repeat protein